jgi:hypothetical protein
MCVIKRSHLQFRNNCALRKAVSAMQTLRTGQNRSNPEVIKLAGRWTPSRYNKVRHRWRM